MQNQINLSAITQFIHQLRSAELSQGKEIKISIQQARLLNLALTELLEKVNQDWESLFNELKRETNSEIVSISMDGGDFTDTK